MSSDEVLSTTTTLSVGVTRALRRSVRDLTSAFSVELESCVFQDDVMGVSGENNVRVEDVKATSWNGDPGTDRSCLMNSEPTKPTPITATRIFDMMVTREILISSSSISISIKHD